MKKTMSLLLAVLLLTLSFSSFGFADSNKDKVKVDKVTINEYELLKDLSKKSTLDLEKKGFQDKDIEKIKNYKDEYAKHLKKYAELDDESLNNLGYTSEKIEMLRVYDGSEAQTIALAASCNLTLKVDYVTWSAAQNRTNARLEYNFTWTGVPLVKKTDIVAVTWNDWTLNGTTANTTYKHIYGFNPDIYGYPTFVANSGPSSLGAGYRFPMAQQDNYYWAQSGKGIFTLYHNYTKKDLSAYAAYGHYTITANLSFFIPGYGAINFTPEVIPADTDRADVKCQN